MKTKKILFIIILVLALAGFACGELDINVVGPTTNSTNEMDNPTDTVDIVETPSPETVPDETSTSEFAQYWVEVEDYRTGVRFAIPCFWVAEIPLPEQDPTGLGSFSVNNFSSDFVASLGNKQAETVWTIGGKKFDLGYVNYGFYNLSASASLNDLAIAMYIGNDESQITSLTPMTINGQAALRVDSTGDRGEGRFYLLDFTGDMAVMVAPFPLEVDAHPDFQAILHSFAVTTEQDVQMPDQMPANPPDGMGAACLGIVADEPASTDVADLQGTLDCNTVTEDDAQLWLICNVRDSFVSRNTQPLLGYMGNLFQLGYWQSEGRSLTREDALQEIVTTLLPVIPGHMTFTLDEAQFPPLFGMTPEDMFGPDANIVEIMYSEGWGQDGNGAALLYFAQDQNGGMYFYGMVFSGTHFDK